MSEQGELSNAIIYLGSDQRILLGVESTCFIIAENEGLFKYDIKGKLMIKFGYYDQAAWNMDRYTFINNYYEEETRKQVA